MLKTIYKLRTYVKYAISGGTATSVQFLFLFLFHDLLGLHIVISASIAFIFAFAASFTLHKFWTFQDESRQDMYLQAYLHFLVGVANLTANAYFMYLFVEIWHIWYIFSQAFVSAGLALGNFLFLRFVVFRRKFRKREEFLNDEAKKRGLKLLIASGIYPPDIGGPATYAEKLYRRLPEYGFRTKVVAYGDPSDSDGPDIMRIKRKKNIFSRYYSYFQALSELIDWADAVYLQDAVSAGLPGFLICYLSRRGYVLKIVGDHAWEQGVQRFGVKEGIDGFQELRPEDIRKKYPFRLYLMRLLQLKVAREAGLIIVPGLYLKETVKKWGIPEDKIKVIYNSVSDIREKFLSREKLREEYGFTGMTVLSAGRLVPWKGFDDLIEAAKSLSSVDDNFLLVIAGSGPQEYELKKKASEMGLNGHVRLIGRLPQRKLWECMRAADIFVLNTGYEGLPHLIIEAMKNGLPVAASDSGGNAELIENGANGILFKYKDKKGITDAITRLYDEAERKKLAEAAGSGLDKFSDGVMLGQTADTIMEFFNKAEVRGPSINK